MLTTAIEGNDTHSSQVVRGPLYQTNLLERGLWLMEGTTVGEREQVHQC